MPFARTSSPMRWLLPVGALGLGLLAFVPAGANVTQAPPRVDVVSAVESIPADGRATSPAAATSVPDLVSAAATPTAPQLATPAAVSTPTWVAAVTAPRPYQVARTQEPWVPTGAVLPVAAPPVIDTPVTQRIARTGLNLRVAPSTDSARVVVLKPREQVAVLEAGEYWTRVRTSTGVEGWAYSPLLADPSEPSRAVAKPPRREVTVAVSGGEVTYEKPRRKRTTLLDYLNGRGMLGD